MNESLVERIKDLIDQRRWSALREAAARVPAPDLADLLPELEKPQRVLLFRSLPRHLSSDVFSYLERNDKDALLKDLTDEETRQLLAALPPDDRTELLEELPGTVTQRLLNLLSPSDLQEAQMLLGYPEESVGRLMTPDYVAVRPDWSISRALEHIRRVGKDSETISTIYVTDMNWILLDALELQRFILAEPQQTVESVMDRSFISLSAVEDREQAVRVMERYGLSAVPVVDTDGVLLGVVTVDDVLDVAQEEATEDIQKGAAVAPLRIGYRDASPSSLYRKRIGWLVALVLVSLGSSGVIGAYQETLSEVIALAFFIPLLIATGGNTGAQAATLTVRALATGDIDLGYWVVSALKELAVGIALGATMGLAAWLLGYVRADGQVALVVALTMTSLVVVANLIGAGIPFVLARLGLDPAVASSPLITTVVDVIGLLLYFSLATLILF